MATHRKFTSIALAIFTFLSTSIYLALPPVVRADERLSDLRAAFYSGRYAEVLTRLYDYREQPYGKQAEVDYMIGSCLCRTGNRDKARKRFEWILSRYRLDGRQRSIIVRALEECSAGGQSRPATFREFSTVTSASERTVGVSGKGGTISRNESISSVAGSVVAVTSETASVIREIAPEEFESRLFDLSQRDKAIQRVTTLAGPNYQVQSVGSFIIATSRSSAAQASIIGQGLERYASFYATQFGIPRPTKFITVYIVPQDYEMHRLARTLHGIEVSRASIGYSFPFDLSMVGILQGTQFGTLAHELFHLMVRNDFGDIPPWLEEGMASLYEVSEVRGNYIAGVPNWRGEILAKFWRDRPSIEQLVQMDWRAFNGEQRRDLFPGAEERQYFRLQAINHATARYLMLYLQENRRLVDVYKAFRKQKVDDLKDTPEQEAVRLLAAVVQKSLPEFDKDFERWFFRLR